MPEEEVEYRGHRIELRTRQAEGVRALEAETELVIDDALVGYGRLPDGTLYLHDYAYDWRDDLMDLARSYIDYQTDAEDVSGERQPGGD